MTWCFRVRIELRPTSRLEYKELEWILDQPDSGQQVKLVALDAASLAEARLVALRGAGYPSKEEAETAGQEWSARLMAAFATLSVGADFGGRTDQAFFTQNSLTAFAPGQRTLNDIHGLMVFECEPEPIFAYAGPVRWGVASSSYEQMVSAVAGAIAKGGLSATQQVTYELFAASFGQESPDAEFALLMMALESMIDPELRPIECQEHIDYLIRLTKDSGLPQSEVSSIVGSLSWLHNESIGQAGRKLAKKLEPKRYAGLAPAAFFTKSYEIRSRLIHGHHPLPYPQETFLWAAHLHVFVADLLQVMTHKPNE